MLVDAKYLVGIIFFSVSKIGEVKIIANSWTTYKIPHWFRLRNQ